MEAKKILSANILDILFENRNKEYGAYDLRNTYNNRINAALGVTTLLIIIICCSAFLGKNSTHSKNIMPLDIDVSLTKKEIEPPKISTTGNCCRQTCNSPTGRK
jgi:protein TonB